MLFSPFPDHILIGCNREEGLVLLFLSPAEHQPEACAEEEAQAGGGVQHRAGPAGGGQLHAGGVPDSDLRSPLILARYPTIISFIIYI